MMDRASFCGVGERRDLPGAELGNKVLREEILAMEVDNPALTTDYLGGNFLARDNPAVSWLRDCVNRSVIEFLMDTIHGWITVFHGSPIELSLLLRPH